MKRFLICMITAFLLSSSYGQTLNNGEFYDFCGTIVNPGGCETFDAGCLTNWTRSHGTPQIFPGAKPWLSYVYMWSTGSTGEGIFGGYQFKRNNPYKVNIRASTIAGNTGTLFIRAANGLTEGSSTDCGGSLPNPNPANQLVAQQTGLTSAWTTYQFTFTANANYSQIWFYPVAATSGVQYNLYVDYIEIEPDCNGNAIFNNGTIPSGTSRAGNIFAGSSAGSGGSGTVVNDPTQATLFIAQNHVTLLPEFRATASTGEFRAVIQSCYDQSISGKFQNILKEDIIIDPQTAKVDSMVMARKNIAAKEEKNYDLRVFPTISSGTVKLQTNNANLKDVTITVNDVTGREVYRISNVDFSKRNNFELNIGGLNNGTYFINVRNSIVSKSVKIIINK